MATTETLKKAFIALEKAENKISQLETAHREPIAIIGMACRFPGGANSPAQYWDILKNGIDTITDVPDSRWDGSAYYDPDPEAAGKMYTTKGGFLNVPVDEFDAAFFKISPKEAQQLDPQQRLLLELSWEALENAGIEIAGLNKSQTGVFVGISSEDYALLNRNYHKFERINAYSITGTVASTAVGRVSYFYGLEGPNMPIDTACSSSLVAVHLACQSLRLRESELALVGGVNLILRPNAHVCFSKLQAISPDGHCKAFDATADGYVRSEGCAMVVMKRLSEAINDGDKILALVKGSAINQDGKSNGLAAPNGLAQQKVIRQALDNAGLKAADIGYIETHGTGTALGDPIEVEAIGKVFTAEHTLEAPLLIGSVKTNIGHTEPVAGVAGLIKVIQSLQHQAIPPNLHFNQPSPHISWDELPIKVPTQLTAWPRIDKPRRAGISAFGFSGTNAHVIIEEAPLTPYQCTCLFL
jgi:acyl transferase domain-containing protein